MKMESQTNTQTVSTAKRFLSIIIAFVMLFSITAGVDFAAFSAAKPKSITLSTTAYTYDGKAKKPTVTVKDSAGKTIAASNYTVAYSNNTNVGTATVKVTFKGNYSGTVSKTFKINPKNTSISSVSALYKGFTVKYAKQATQTTGYQVQYSTSSNFSNAKTVTINKNTTVVKNVTGLTAKKKYYVRIRTYKTVGKTNYFSGWSSAKNVTTSSYPTSITLSTTSYTYDGKVKKPSVTVKHGPNKIASKYYTVSYASGRKNVGTYTVTIKFKSPYSGTVKKTFKINPKNTSISSVTAQSKGFTVKWSKQATQTTGYQVQYSTASNFSNAKTVTINKNTTVSKAVTGLAANKKYYVRIRTYKTVDKTNYYSSWSGAKTVTTKAASTGNSLNSDIQNVYNLVNQQRTKYGVSKLTYRNDLQSAADTRAKEIATNFSHTRPNGSACFTVINVSYKTAGENIAYGSNNASGTMNQWMDSQSHRENILSTKYTGIAVGCYEKGGVKYWVQLFVG